MMGYMGLDSWGDSDGAADLFSDATDAVIAVLRKGLEEEGNAYNTDGPVNVALVAEDMFMRNGDVSHIYSDEAHKLLTEVVKRLKKAHLKMHTIPVGDWDGKDMHVKAYERMIANMTKIINSLEAMGYGENAES
jgi:hypothetical protein